MANDFRLQSDFRSHLKIRRLEQRLGSTGVLGWISLVAYASSNKPDGRLTGLGSEDIALIAGWSGEEDFTAVLVELRLLDRSGKTFCLHNWAKRQPWVMSSEKRQTKARKAAYASWENRRKPTDTMVSDDSMMPATSNAQSSATSMLDGCSEQAHSNAPYPTQPNHTQPKNGALFLEPNKGRSKPQKNSDTYETWLTKSLIPVFPSQGRCQQANALRFLRKEKFQPEQLDTFVKLAEQWTPIWVETGRYPGLHSFLTEGKYREAPANSHCNGRASVSTITQRTESPEEYERRLAGLSS